MARRRPVLRFRKSGALLVAAGIATVGAVPVAGVRWALAPILLVPLAVLAWAWRAGTDVDAHGLRVRALLGSADIAWERVDRLGPDGRGGVVALLTDGALVRLTGVPADRLPALLEAGGQPLDRAGSGGTGPGAPPG